jgi:hypothetical protein
MMKELFKDSEDLQKEIEEMFSNHPNWFENIPKFVKFGRSLVVLRKARQNEHRGNPDECIVSEKMGLDKLHTTQRESSPSNSQKQNFSFLTLL